ncbi:alpha/beta-hydrolase [Neocallimastix lanati (nom. inval.)]|jgi:pimeloyl-ACP methyl ester carboxylesterase|nr:alpha/beta-hydrolase [Neocallimastix sp. JGI-2020a]
MSTTDSVNIDISQKDVPEKQKKEKRSFKRKILRVLLWIFIILIALILLFTGYTLICNSVDKKKIKNYSEKYSKKVEINGHQMSYSIVGEKNNQTIAILPGMGCPSPIIEFKPLAEALSDKFKVITIEPFGYGFSDDVVDTNRDFSTMISEIREGVKKIGINNYYIMGHSMGGAFSLKWSNQYSDEVLGVIALDSSVSGTEKDISKEELVGSYIPFKKMNSIGLGRLIIKFGQAPYSMDTTYPYTDEEIDVEELLLINHAFTKGQWDDIETFLDRLASLEGVKFPDRIPTLTFLSKDNVKQNTKWEGLHHEILGNNTRNEILVLDGSHYIHYDQKNSIVNKIKEWIQ